MNIIISHPTTLILANTVKDQLNPHLEERIMKFLQKHNFLQKNHVNAFDSNAHGFLLSCVYFQCQMQTHTQTLIITTDGVHLSTSIVFSFG